VQGASMAAMAIAAIDTAAVKENQKDAVVAPKALLISIVDVSGSMQHNQAITECIEKAFDTNQKAFEASFPSEAEQLFLQHTTNAYWVSGEDFLTPSAQGGSLLSSAYEKVRDVVEKYKSTDTQLFIQHITDGDNWHGDSVKLNELLDDIMPHIEGLRYSKIEGAWGGMRPDDFGESLNRFKGGGKVLIEPYSIVKPNQKFYPKPIV